MQLVKVLTLLLYSLLHTAAALPNKNPPYLEVTVKLGTSSESQNVFQEAPDLIPQATTPDGTCGNRNSGNGRGYTCSTTLCCSKWGWCGVSADHCGAECQPAFGRCNDSPGPQPTPTPGPNPGPLPYGQIITACRRPGYMALTFDDGPHIYTSRLLQILKNNNVKATFFVNGQNWGNPITDPSTDKQAVLRRMLSDGHQIGSHTWAHADLSTLSSSGIANQMGLLDNALQSIIGRRPKYMRPPYFSCTTACQSTLASLQYYVIYSNLDTLDWANATPDTVGNSKAIFSNSVNPSSPSSSSWLVLAHDVHYTTVEELAQHMITTARNKGFTFGTVGECMGDAPSNWYR